MAAKVMSYLLIISVISLSISSVYGFPTGAPSSVCSPEGEEGIPRHGPHGPQPEGTNPYQIIASDDKYNAGKQISVTISGDLFKGYFIQARDTKTNQLIGSFSETTNSHPVDCSAVTHSESGDKQETTLIWNAPDIGEGDVYFIGTIVKNFATFWIKLKSKTQ